MSGRWIKIGLLFLSFQLFGIATEAAAQPVEDSLTIAPNTFQFNNHKIALIKDKNDIKLLIDLSNRGFVKSRKNTPVIFYF